MSAGMVMQIDRHVTQAVRATLTAVVDFEREHANVDRQKLKR